MMVDDDGYHDFETTTMVPLLMKEDKSRKRVMICRVKRVQSTCGCVCIKVRMVENDAGDDELSNE
jgi:hypothetical protein